MIRDRQRLPAMRDVWPHDHGKTTHQHAWSTTVHDHLLRQVCGRAECQGFATHNIHRAPASIEGIAEAS